MIHADIHLARRLEDIISQEWRRLAEIGQAIWPEKKPTYLDVAGGCALWLGEGSPVNVAAGLAMNGPIGEEELVQVEDFYAKRGATPILATCPFADPTLFALLGKRRWWITEFENVLALELSEEDPDPSAPSPVFPPGIEARACAPEERELWGRLAARGFSDDQEASPAQEDFGRLMAARPDSILILGWVDGRPAGTGSLGIDGDVAWLSGDSTLPEYRRRGVQQAIQRHRLHLAREAGCTLAVTESAPGSGSQRNMERLGFRVVYTHLEFAKV